MIFVDTDVLIDAIRRDAATMDALDRLRAEGENVAVTSINVAEVLRGTPPHGRQREATLRILRGTVEVPFGPSAAKRFGTLQYALDRAGAAVPMMDAMVAAVVLENGGRLLTGNRQDFQRIAGLDVLNPAL